MFRQGRPCKVGNFSCGDGKKMIPFDIGNGAEFRPQISVIKTSAYRIEMSHLLKSHTVDSCYLEFQGTL